MSFPTSLIFKESWMTLTHNEKMNKNYMITLIPNPPLLGWVRIAPHSPTIHFDSKVCSQVKKNKLPLWKFILRTCVRLWPAQMAKPYTDKVYFTKQNVKMATMHNNRNMQMSILNVNGKSIITLLNKVPYLSDSRHLKSRYLQRVIK